MFEGRGSGERLALSGSEGALIERLQEDDKTATGNRQADESHGKRRYVKCGLGFAYPVSALQIMRRAIAGGRISDFN